MATDDLKRAIAANELAHDPKSAALAVKAVAGVLRRFGARLTDEDREDLALILEEKSDKLMGRRK